MLLATVISVWLDDDRRGESGRSVGEIPPHPRCRQIAVLEAEDVGVAGINRVGRLLEVRVIQQIEAAGRELVPEEPREGVIEGVEL